MDINEDINAEADSDVQNSLFFISLQEIMIYNTRSRKRKYDDLTNRSLKEDLEPKTHKDISLKGVKKNIFKSNSTQLWG